MLAQKALELTKFSRQEILHKMETVQEKAQPEATPQVQQN
jgi:hypothetical protein